MSAVSLTAVVVVLSLLLCWCSAQPPAVECQTECPTSPPYPDLPTVTVDSDFRYITTSRCPVYSNPNWNNPGSACLSMTTYQIPLIPTMASKTISAGEALEVYNGITYLKTDPKPILGAMGVWVNGVLVYGVGSPCGFGSTCPNQGAPSDWVDAIESEGHTVDQCGGHPQNRGEYHVHSGLFITNSSERAQCMLPSDTAGQHSELLAWMFDGVGLYGPNSLGGVPPTDLDECGGHTHEIDGAETYHYHLPDPPAFPWIIGCFKACPEVSNNEMEFGFLSTDDSYGCTSTTGTTTSPGTTDGAHVFPVPSLGFLLVVISLHF